MEVLSEIYEFFSSSEVKTVIIQHYDDFLLKHGKLVFCRCGCK